MDPIRIAVVGVGKIARDEHLPSIGRDGRFALAALVSGGGATAPGVPTFPDLAALLRSGVGLDAVAVCTPPGPRTDVVRAALDAGLHVLMEKPPTPTVGELRDLAARAARAGRTLFTAWHSQHNAAVDALAERLAGRRLRRLSITWKEDVRRWHPGQDWIWEPSGFGVFDPGINALSILTRVLPAPAFVRAARLVVPANRAMPIAAAIDFASPALAEGGTMAAAFDWRQEGEQVWEIAAEGEDGTALRLTGGGTTLSVDGAVVEDAPRREYERLYARFAELVASGKATSTPRPSSSWPTPSWWAGARRPRLSRADAAVDPLGPRPARDAREGTPAARATLALCFALLALAGWVDAVGFVRWQGLYASFMSGNTTQFGASPAVGDWGAAAAAGRALLAFVVGVVAGELIGPAVGRWRGPALVGAEAALLWGALGAAALGWGDGAAAAPAGLAMGLQTAAVHEADGVSVALTYVTGTLVNLGRGVAGALRGTAPWGACLPFAGFWLSMFGGALAGAGAARAGLAAALAGAAALASALAVVAGALAARGGRAPTD